MKELFLYESHTGGFYVEEKQIENKSLYCEDCDDFDFFLGTFETKEEAENLINLHGDKDFYSEDYIQDFTNSIFKSL